MQVHLLGIDDAGEKISVEAIMRGTTPNRTPLSSSIETVQSEQYTTFQLAKQPQQQKLYFYCGDVKSVEEAIQRWESTSLRMTSAASATAVVCRRLFEHRYKNQKQQ